MRDLTTSPMLTMAASLPSLTTGTTDPALGHLAGEVGEVVVGGAGVDVPGHDPTDGPVEDRAAAAYLQVPDDVTLADDPVDRSVAVGDDDGTDLVLGQEGPAGP